MNDFGSTPLWRCVRSAAAVVAASAIFLGPAGATQQPSRGRVPIAAMSGTVSREWGQRIDSMRRAGELRLRMTRDDVLVRGRTHERLDQYHRGVRVFGADVAQQLAFGQVVSAFGNVFEDIDIDTSPDIGSDDARRIVETRAGIELRREPELVIFPLEAGGYALTWRVRAAARGDIRQYFVDARTGAIVFDYSDLQSQSAVGRSVGVLGDTKKFSAMPSGGQFLATDRLRPPAMTTYDMKGDVNRVENYLNGVINLAPSDVATDSDNDWTDGAIVDAHVYSGWTYDYFFKRFGRRGLDNREIQIKSLAHPIRRDQVFTLFEQFSEYFTNAFYAGDGIAVYGVGLPPGVTLGGQSWDFVSGALDVVAHELTHGVTDFSSNLSFFNEPGALNEAFSDIMGTSVEFFYHPPGSGNQRADYLIGEDVVRGGPGNGFRSMSDPAQFGDPDHYSRRFLGTADNGGVHINSGIPNHAFYLAIESGTNRTSGLSVQGVGAANREQIERVFYRAFTQLLPSSANFSQARSATIQAARDLFGTNSAAERAVTQAWTAVGVN